MSKLDEKGSSERTILESLRGSGYQAGLEGWTCNPDGNSLKEKAAWRKGWQAGNEFRIKDFFGEIEDF